MRASLRLKFWVILSVCAVFFGASAEAYEFGSSGRSGRWGDPGRRGRDGSDIEISASTHTQVFRLEGENGYDGGAGESAEHAMACYQPQGGDWNLQGASGGEGGQGGGGGAGGRGGDAVIHYDDLSDLKSIVVYAPGAVGGRGASGGYGGQGCICTQSFWTKVYCNYGGWRGHYPNCRSVYYNCYDGRNGQVGSTGLNGMSGRMGTVTLVQNPKSISDERALISVGLADFSHADQVLVENLWAEHTGLHELLGSGSFVSDSYRELIEQEAQSVRLDWRASRPAEYFAEYFAQLALKKGQVSVEIPDLWTISYMASAVHSSGPNQKVWTVERAYKPQEVGSLADLGFTSQGADLRYTIRDSNALSPLIPASVHLIYKTRFFFFFWRTKYEGVVPTEFLTEEGSDYVVHVGRLPIDLDDLEGPVKAYLHVTLSLDKKSLERHFERKAKL